MLLRSGLIILLTIIVASPIYSQGIFLEKSESGIGLSGGYFSSDDASGLQASIGYSVRGIVDVGIDIGLTSFDKVEVNSTSFIPSIKFYPIKQTNDVPLSVYIGGSYGKTSFSGDDLDYSSIDMEGDSYDMYIGISSKILISGNSYLVPGASIAKINTKIKVTDNRGNNYTEKDDTTGKAFSVGLLFKGTGKYVFINPIITFIKGESSLGINAGLIFLK